ncbi:MAG: MoaD/ThiS family protein [Desulfobacterales bacterium]|nr:MoaD/ThiS family protein [Desulfobacterales bacterium]
MNIKLACGSRLLLDRWSGDLTPTIEELLNSVKNSHPQLEADWCDERGRLRASLAVFVNGEHIRYRKGLRTELKDGDEVYVIPLITGG